MINAFVLLIVAGLFFGLGHKVSTIRANHLLARMQDEREKADAYYNTVPWAEEQFAHVIVYDCPNEHAIQGQLCNTGPHGMWVCLERILYAEEMEAPLYDVELGVDESLKYEDGGVWEEVEIQNDCGYGCKIYQHNKTGRRVLAHNSAYGCTRSFNRNKE